MKIETFNNDDGRFQSKSKYAEIGDKLKELTDKVLMVNYEGMSVQGLGRYIYDQNTSEYKFKIKSDPENKILFITKIHNKVGLTDTKQEKNISITTVDSIPDYILSRLPGQSLTPVNKEIKEALQNMNGNPICIKFDAPNQEKNARLFIYGQQTRTIRYTTRFNKKTSELFVFKVEHNRKERQN